MKALLSLSVAIAFSLSAFSQETPVPVGEARNGTTAIADLSYKLKGDTVYALHFFNQQFPAQKKWETVSFKQKGSTLDELYTAFKSVFKPENKNNRNYVLAMKIGDEDVFVSGHRELGVLYALLTTSTGYVKFTEAQIDPLFGKGVQ